ncbi:hypothetical protein C8Q75DRAFT_266463 [Abortiporus biennis]|nr:hypothetical protein C8Q75DRAFT_266463 [Abortiporus biennis]
MAPTPSTSPYNDTDADIILRSNGGVDFRAHKLILSKASSFFEDMFKLPQNEKMKAEGIQVITMEEDQHTVRLVLDFCYPVAEPMFSPSEMEAVVQLLRALDKYHIQGGMKRTERQLRVFAPTHPLRVYAVACRYGMNETAEIAARHSLQAPLWPSIAQTKIPEFSLITADCLQTLLQYHQRCGVAAASLVDDLKWIIDPNFTWFQCKSCSPASGGPVRIKNGSMTYHPRSWWLKYMKDVQKELYNRPIGSVVLDADIISASVAVPIRVCDTCRATCVGDMLKFCTFFAKKLDETTSRVPLQLELK